MCLWEGVVEAGEELRGCLLVGLMELHMVLLAGVVELHMIL
jgi:hypothetical protein